MRFPAKFAAIALLLAFWAVPGFAAMQCRMTSQPAMHCGPHCSMMHMAAMSGQPQMQAVGVEPPCCRVLPSAPAPKPVSATQGGSRQVAQIRDVVAGGVIPAMPRVEQTAAPDRIPHRRSQSVLCTFLI